MREKLKVHDGNTPGKVIEVKLEYPKPKVETMNNDMKCPVCNVGYVHESVNHWCCDYEFCPSYDETDTETYDILIRTRKALKIAVDALKRIDETRSGIKENLHATNGRALNAGNGFCWATIDDIHNALAKITALEQKD